MRRRSRTLVPSISAQVARDPPRSVARCFMLPAIERASRQRSAGEPGNPSRSIVA
jgi:hypothetical protein